MIGNCYRPSAGLPYQPLIEALRDHLPQVNLDRLKQVKPLWLAEVAKLVPELGDLLESKLQENLPFQPEEEQLRLFIALMEFLIALSDARPLLLFLDDLHHADGSTLKYLHYLAHHLPRKRILLLGTYRPEEVSEAHQLAELIGQLYPQGLLERMSLGRLSQEETALLIEEMLGLEEGEEEFIRKMYQETEGNPFFIIELVKSVIEGGALYIEEGKWHTPSAEAVEAYIPPTVQEFIATRSRRLSQRGRELLNLAAVAGQEIDLKVLAHANGSKEGELMEALEELTATYFLEETERGYSFSHELIRQVIYEELRPIKRWRFHLRVGEALESAYPQRLDQLAGELAHHFYQAQRWDSRDIRISNCKSASSTFFYKG